MLRATEMAFWKRSEDISIRDRVRNDRVRQIMEVENDIVFDLMTKQLVWYGHVNVLAGLWALRSCFGLRGQKFRT